MSSKKIRNTFAWIVLHADVTSVIPPQIPFRDNTTLNYNISGFLHSKLHGCGVRGDDQLKWNRKK